MTLYDWTAMAARQDRETDRDRERAEAQKPKNRGKRKFRKKKGGTRIFNPGEADRFLARSITPQQRVNVGKAMEPGGSYARPQDLENLPIVGGGVGRQAATGLLRNLPGMGRYLGNTQAGVGRYLANLNPAIARALPWLGGVAGGVALERVANWGLDQLDESGSAYGNRSMVPAQTGGGPVAMQQSPLGPLSRGQEFPGGPFVVKTWDTYPGPGVTGGGNWPIFALLSDGRIVVSKPNGSWKVYRPKKNLVISSNPRLRDVRKLDRMHRRVVGMMKRMVPRPARRK